MRKLICLGIIALVVTAFGSGCATVPTPRDKVTYTPPDRLLAYQIKDDAHSSEMIFIRDTGMLGSGCYLALYINRTLSARIDPAEIAVFYAEPGETLLSVDFDPYGKGLCAMGQHGQYITTRETILKPNQSKTFRITVSPDGRTDIQRY